MLVYTYKPNTQEPEAGESGVPGQPRLQSQILLRKRGKAYLAELSSLLVFSQATEKWVEDKKEREGKNNTVSKLKIAEETSSSQIGQEEVLEVTGSSQTKNNISTELTNCKQEKKQQGTYTNM